MMSEVNNIIQPHKYSNNLIHDRSVLESGLVAHWLSGNPKITGSNLRQGITLS